MKKYSLDQSAFAHFFVADTRSAPLWLIVRVYLGWNWLMAGYEKLTDPNAVWVGSHAGTALAGFIQGALAKTGGAHPDVQGWYAAFLQNAVLPHVVSWSYAVTAGEMLIGLGLIAGCLTGAAAFFGVFMNLNFLLSGAVSVNPIWLVLGLGILLSRRVAGHGGLDRYVLPFLDRHCRPHARPQSS